MPSFFSPYLVAFLKRKACPLLLAGPLKVFAYQFNRKQTHNQALQ